MSNSLAIVLGLLILVLCAVDFFLFGTEHFVFLGKKFYEFIEWIAFWR